MNRIHRWCSTFAVLSLLATTTGCAAIRTPRVATLPATAAPIPLRVMVCPGAEDALGAVTRDHLFTRIDPAATYPAAERAPDLVIVGSSARYRRKEFEKPIPTITRVTEVFSIVSLGLLPTYIPHQGEATITFRRPGPAESPCAPADAGAPTFQVRATPKTREFLAFWIFAPALIAALPGWDLVGGDDFEVPAIDPTQWLSAAVYERRNELLRFAQR